MRRDDDLGTEDALELVKGCAVRSSPHDGAACGSGHVAPPRGGFPLASTAWIAYESREDVDLSPQTLTGTDETPAPPPAPAALARLRAAMRRRRGATLAIAGLAVGGVAIAFRSTRGTAAVVVPAAREDLLQTLVATGRVVPPAEVTLASRLVGTVAAVAVEEGARVKAGQLLVQLEDAELQAAVAQAQAELDQATAALDKLRRVSSRVSQETLRQAEADLTLAEKALQRTAALSRVSAASRAELDEARKAVDVARSRQQSALLQVASTGARGSDARLAAAAIARARASLAQAEARLAQARILSPFAGLVIRRSVEPGDAVQPGSALAVVVQAGETQIAVDPDEKSLAVLAVGQHALASADAFPERRFDAEVFSIAPAVDAQRGTIEVKLRVPRPPPYLRPYMTASVDIEVARKPRALVIPADALRDGGSAQPWVMLAVGGRATRRAVQLGIRGERTVEIRGGLRAGELVVVSADRPLRPGQRVRPTPPAER